MEAKEKHNDHGMAYGDGITPSLIGYVISSANHSFQMIKKSGACVINLPTTNLLNEIIGIGNTSGSQIDKFEKFKLTAQKATIVDAPMIKECYANFECKVVDRRMISKYNFFILE